MRPRWLFAGLFLFSLLFFLALLRVPRVDGQLIGSDGAYYYVYLRSLAIDHDLSFANEYAYYQLPPTSPGLTPTGLSPNKYAIGPALLWLPFFLAAHLIALLGQALGLGLVPDGYGYLYQGAVAIGSIVYGTLGFWLAYRCARRFCSQLAAITAVVLLWLAGNAFYYMVFEPSMSHMVSLFSVALLLSIWFLRFRDAAALSPATAAMLGAAAGLVLLVRLQDAPFLLLPYGSILLRTIQHWCQGDSGRARAWLGRGLIAGIATIVTFSPQSHAWHVLYGTWVASPYLGEHIPTFYWLQPQLAGVLVSTFHGLFSWHPIYLCALIGLALLIRRDRSLALGLLAVLALDVYIVAAFWVWWQGDSFGGRMFLNAIWGWVLGLAALLDWLRARRLFYPALAIGLLLIGWNGLSLIQYRLGFVPMGVPLTWEQMTIERIKLPWTLWQRIR
ncbi:MAG: hypothetical protein ACJ8CR_02720 [Roseiflexaceae bacterium]